MRGGRAVQPPLRVVLAVPAGAGAAAAATCQCAPWHACRGYAAPWVGLVDDA